MTIAALGLMFVLVTSPNTCDPQTQGCFGSVSNPFLIQQTEVTNADWTDFLNAVATVSDPAGLWNPSMDNPSACYQPGIIDVCGGISRNGVPGAWSYTTIPGRELHPVNLISWYDMLRFTNWLHNGRPVGLQGPSTTETGAYAFTGVTAVGPREPDARVFLPTENEWYAAAYWNPTGHWEHTPTMTPAVVGAPPVELPGVGNCDLAVNQLTDAGSYPLATSGSGALDMAGNVYELFEDNSDGTARTRGGSWGKFCFLSYADRRTTLPQTSEILSYGFRVAAPLPEPSSGSLLLTGLFALGIIKRNNS